MRSLMTAMAAALTAAVAFGQGPAAPVAPAGPAPTGLVVGSGNFFSPIVSDLDKAVAFYGQGLGLELPPSPSNADTNLPLRQMFGLPDAHLRWMIGRPGTARGGVEIIEARDANGKPVVRRLQDGGAFTLVATVRDLDATLARLKTLGAPIVSRGGAPVSVMVGGAKARAITVADPDAHFVELVQPEPLPETQAPATANVIGVRVRLTVEDAEKAARLYGDTLGFQARGTSRFAKDAAMLQVFGMAGAEYRTASFEVPTTGLGFDVIEFKGVDRRTVPSNIQDPGSTRIQLQVRDAQATIDALKKVGGVGVSTGGGTVGLPGRGGATTTVGIVRDPNNLFLVLLQVAPRS
jgi:catechol 2,3-dioxygenase-like lactoylglutathione lyase family enzyme